MRRDLINMNTSIWNCHSRNPQWTNYAPLGARRGSLAPEVIRGDNKFALRANLLPRLENGVSAVIASIHRVRIST
jgi:hypothetical protein